MADERDGPRPDDLEEFFNRPELKQERQLQPSNDLIAKYRLFQETTGALADVVYHPCSATDNSPSIAFPKSRVIYVEQDPIAVEVLQRAGLEAHNASAEEYDPGAVDVLIMLNPVISPDFPSQFVVPNGHVVCNDYHGTATSLRDDDAYELQGVILPSRDGRLFMDREGLDQYWQEVETDEEFRNVPMSWGAVPYDMAASTVEAITGRTDNILQEYRRIIDMAREGQMRANEEMMAANPGIFAEDSSLLDALLTSDTFMYTHEGQQFIIDTNLPKKKGTVDDLFIFKKKAVGLL